MADQAGQPIWFWFGREGPTATAAARSSSSRLVRCTCRPATCRQLQEQNQAEKTSMRREERCRNQNSPTFKQSSPSLQPKPTARIKLEPKSEVKTKRRTRLRLRDESAGEQVERKDTFTCRPHLLRENLASAYRGGYLAASSLILLPLLMITALLLLSSQFCQLADSSPAHQSQAQPLSVSQQLDRLLLDELPLVQGEAGAAFGQRRRPLDYVKRRTRRAHHRRRRHQQQQQQSGSIESSADRPLVETKRGKVRGITQKIFTGKFVDAFLGIPYAQPPVGKWRFRHPQPVLPWPGELDASQMSSSCYQTNDTFFGANFLGTLMWNANTPLSEDCLFLNIWSPFGLSNASLSQSPGRPSSSNQAEQQRLSAKNQKQAPKSGAQQLRPVLVWIFGGGFYSGTSSLTLYEGGVLASEEDIVVVSLNYRVSALGFLYFGRPDAPGNSGLFDQLLALQWISDNIDQFGGDPARVTIFGESAGAVSIAFHLLSPLSRNLFSQAILQSGAATCPWGFMETTEIIENGLQLAKLVNCPSNKSELDAVLECLNRVDPMQLVSAEVGKVKSVLNFPFVPVVDGTFLLENPGESLVKSNFKRAKILLGSNFDEGNSWLIYLPEFNSCSPPLNEGGEQREHTESPVENHQKTTSSASGVDLDSQALNSMDYSSIQQHPSSSFLETFSLQYRQPPPAASTAATAHHSNPLAATSPESLQIHQVSQTNNNAAADERICTPNQHPSLSREDFLRVLSEDINPYANHPLAKDAIVFEYSNWNNPNDLISMADALDKIVGDYYFTCHVNEFAQRYAQASNSVYMYHFRQRASISPWPKWMGVLHGDELSFVFGEPLNTQHFNYTPKEIELSKRIMNYWANFAKYGNPTKTGDNSSTPEKWPEYGDKKQYFELHGDYARVGRGPRAKQCAFWAHYLPRLLDSFERNQCPSKHPSNHLPRNTLLDQESYQRLLIGPQSTETFSWTFIMSLIVILVLSTILGLLVYAKRSGKLHINLSSNTSNNNTDTIDSGN